MYVACKNINCKQVGTICVDIDIKVRYQGHIQMHWSIHLISRKKWDRITMGYLRLPFKFTEFCSCLWQVDNLRTKGALVPLIEFGGDDNMGQLDPFFQGHKNIFLTIFITIIVPIHKLNLYRI